MRITLLILLLCAVGALAASESSTKLKTKEPTCSCPTLEQLLEAKAAKESKERTERAEQRRAAIKSRLSELIGK